MILLSVRPKRIALSVDLGMLNCPIDFKLGMIIPLTVRSNLAYLKK